MRTSLFLAVAVSLVSAESEPRVLPAFVPTTVTGPLVEQFQLASWQDAWVVSQAKKEGSDSEERYSGVWSVEVPSVFPGLEGDKGLVMKTASSHHAISHVFEKPINPKGKDLVVQYEVKFQNSHECGGAYIKLLTYDAAFSAEENASPYTIMFGPDKCGSDNKLHFIFRHTNPVTGVTEEKHLLPHPQAVFSKVSTLYTLVVRPDNTFEIFVNQKSVKSGSLLKDFSPSVQGEKEITDVNDVKPEDWNDEKDIVDLEAVKPADWDESALRLMPASQPEGWLADEPSLIADPTAESPVDWDEEEDGEWTAPSIPNPACAVGCGEWKRPSIANPEYKGKWSAPLISNPEYSGAWTARKVPNPAYIESSNPSDFTLIVRHSLSLLYLKSAVGFELWTIQSDILFDNIYIGHSLADAKTLAAQSFALKHTSEQLYEAEKKEDTPETPETLLNTEQTLLEQAMTHVEAFQKEFFAFIEAAKVDAVAAVQAFPHVIASVFGLVMLLLLPFFMLSGFSSETKKDDTAKKVNKIEEIVEESEVAEVKSASESGSPKKKEKKERKKE